MGVNINCVVKEANLHACIHVPMAQIIAGVGTLMKQRVVDLMEEKMRRKINDALVPVPQ